MTEQDSIEIDGFLNAAQPKSDPGALKTLVSLILRKES
jgi:hypothetical protein